MAISDPTLTLSITPTDPVVLERAVGTRIVPLEGEVWITQHGDSRDIILHPGQEFIIDRPACLVMTGIHLARVAVHQPDPGAAPVRQRAAAGWFTWWPLRWNSASQKLMGAGLRRIALG
ncbi:MAG: DUF2917 domain-containing protein [Zoogloeaceae bacterium]|nr:DUF2917 domain-containing protein [Zoogloeaceae bacterium]